MTEHETIMILAAEFVGMAKNIDGVINVGGVEIQMSHKHDRAVYVRRFGHDLSVAEIHLAEHDAYAQEELDRKNDEAERYPLGPKEYWRSEMVNKTSFFGEDDEDEGHPFTDEEFERYWDDLEEIEEDEYEDGLCPDCLKEMNEGGPPGSQN